MNLKNLFYVFFYVGLVALIVGILAKLIGFEIFTLKPLSYLKFTGVCVLYSIACAVAVMAFPKE